MRPGQSSDERDEWRYAFGRHPVNAPYHATGWSSTSMAALSHVTDSIRHEVASARGLASNPLSKSIKPRPP